MEEVAASKNCVLESDEDPSQARSCNFIAKLFPNGRKEDCFIFKGLANAETNSRLDIVEAAVPKLVSPEWSRSQANLGSVEFVQSKEPLVIASGLEQALPAK
jgi:hypothetical protein